MILSQVYLLNRRFQQHQQIIWQGKGGVQDRTIYEDSVFAKVTLVVVVVVVVVAAVVVVVHVVLQCCRHHTHTSLLLCRY